MGSELGEHGAPSEPSLDGHVERKQGEVLSGRVKVSRGHDVNLPEFLLGHSLSFAQWLKAKDEARASSASEQEVSRELPLTRAAESASERFRKDLFSMLASAADARGKQRRATELDATDFEAAFDKLVNPRSHPVWIDVVADAGLLLAGLFCGIGSNVLTGNPPNAFGGLICIGAGLFVGLFCVVIKYIPSK
jgi:hypothetical protein